MQLIVVDDNSTASGHTAAIKELITSYGVHFVLGASPAFADAETVQVDAAGLLNFHCCAASPKIYSRNLRNAYGERGGAPHVGTRRMSP